MLVTLADGPVAEEGEIRLGDIVEDAIYPVAGRPLWFALVTKIQDARSAWAADFLIFELTPAGKEERGLFRLQFERATGRLAWGSPEGDARTRSQIRQAVRGLLARTPLARRPAVAHAPNLPVSFLRLAYQAIRIGAVDAFRGEMLALLEEPDPPPELLALHDWLDVIEAALDPKAVAASALLAVVFDEDEADEVAQEPPAALEPTDRFASTLPLLTHALTRVGPPSVRRCAGERGKPTSDTPETPMPSTQTIAEGVAAA
jgi:hypothetical protein